MRQVNVLIVDDHPLVRSGLHELIKNEPDLEVCCEAASLEEAEEAMVSTIDDLRENLPTEEEVERAKKRLHRQKAPRELHDRQYGQSFP